MTYIAPLSPRQVLVTLGHGFMTSALGTQEAHRATMINDPNRIGYAAADAGLVTIDAPRSVGESPLFRLPTGEEISVGEIDNRWGNRLRENMGIRFLSPENIQPDLPTDIAAPLAHDLERGSEPGGLRERAGLRQKDFKDTPLEDMRMLFDDNLVLGPNLQAQLFFSTGLMALAALPVPLSQLIPAHEFRVAAGTCFPGVEAWESLSLRGVGDKFAYRLASTLSTHGPGLLNIALSPVLPLSAVNRKPELVKLLQREGQALRNVPQAPLVSSAACASALVNFCDAAPSLLFDYPGWPKTKVLLWTSADASLLAGARILEGFGRGAMMTRVKLMKTGRHVSECLTPFDADADGNLEDKTPLGGTVVGHAGYGVLVTTLQFVLEQAAQGIFLPVTSIIVGWGQSGESGGKAHAAGVGYGGENAIISALMMAYEGHGYGVNDFEHLIAHATGTGANSKTDLTSVQEARSAAGQTQGYDRVLRRMTVGAPKTSGAGHPMAPAGHLALQEGIYYVNGEPTVGIPTLKNVSSTLNNMRDHFELSRNPIPGSRRYGVIMPVQGFAGYDGAVALMPATRETLSRYRDRSGVLGEYLNHLEALQAEVTLRERRAARRPKAALGMALLHCWAGAR